jgi:ArsR family transcriptional regulator
MQMCCSIALSNTSVKPHICGILAGVAIRILNLIAEQEICVCYFVEVLDAPQSKISRHLAYLRKAGIVGARREGKWMHYRLAIPADSHAAAILEATLSALRKDREIQQDFSRLDKACCGPRSLVQLIGAPPPAGK